MAEKNMEKVIILYRVSGSTLDSGKYCLERFKIRKSDNHYNKEFKSFVVGGAYSWKPDESIDIAGFTDKKEALEEGILRELQSIEDCYKRICMFKDALSKE